MRIYSRLHNDYSRRAFIEKLALTTLGVSFGKNALGQAASTAKADHCILLMMDGGMSHLDTFDPKPGKTDVMGATQVMKTSITGEPFADTIPQLAAEAKKLAVIRNMYQKTGDHVEALYTMRTSYDPLATIVHPSLGPWAQALAGRKDPRLPDSVTINVGARHPGAGFMDPSFSPMPVDQPDRGVSHMRPFGINANNDNAMRAYDETLTRRLELMERLDEGFRNEVKHEKVKAYTQFYDETLKFIKGEDLKLFDLNEEKDDIRDRYGRNPFGQGCLLAKRLVEGGVRFVEVGHRGWDTHIDHFEKAPDLARIMDQAAATLLRDLEAEGMLGRTMVVIATEFGRTPLINGNSGRDHHSIAFSCVLAGGGVQGGQIIGKTDESGERLESDPVEPKHLNATIAHALGLDLNQVVYSPSGRPFTVATHKDGQSKIESAAQPIMQVFS